MKVAERKRHSFDFVNIYILHFTSLISHLSFPILSLDSCTVVERRDSCLGQRADQ